MKSLQFLNPIMLAGLLVIAVPVIIHLISRIRAKKINFSTVRFLEQIKIEASRMEKLRNLLLLFLRILLIAFIAFAFARPFFSNKTGKWASGGTKAAVIILDNSYSMGYGDYFSKGTAEALKITADYGPGDRLAVISGSERPKIFLQMTEGGKGAEIAVKSIRLSNLGTEFEPGIRLAEEMLMEAAVSTKTIYLITDNQESGWTKFDFNQKLSPGVLLKIIRVNENDNKNRNTAVTGVDLISESGRLSYNRIKARLTRFADIESSVKVELDVDGVKQEKKLLIRPGETKVAEFTVDMKLNTAHQGYVKIEESDGLKPDNRYYFSVNKKYGLPILLLSGKAGSHEPVYLSKALSPMELKGLFEIKEKNAALFVEADKEKTRTIFLSGIEELKESAVPLLRRFVEDGGTFVLIPSGFTGEAELKRYNSLIKGLLPAELKSVEGGTDNWKFGFGLSPRLLDNPVLEGLTDPKYADWSSVSVIKYIKIGKTDGNVILSYDNGDPAFIEKRLGKGRVMLFSTSFDGTWNNFVLTPLFLPFIHQLVYTSGGEEENGEVLYFTSDAVSTSSEGVIKITSPSGREFKSGAEAEEPGIYSYTKKDKSVEYSAVNVRGFEEGDLAYTGTEEKELKLKNPLSEMKEVKNSLEYWTKKEEEEKQRWWWYLVLLALVAGTGEMILANYRR